MDAQSQFQVGADMLRDVVLPSEPSKTQPYVNDIKVASSRTTARGSACHARVAKFVAASQAKAKSKDKSKANHSSSGTAVPPRWKPVAAHISSMVSQWINKHTPGLGHIALVESHGM